MMDTMEARLGDVLTAEGDLSRVTVAATRAALAVLQKYRRLSGECELYDIALGERGSPTCILGH